jgi:hypothetical protein
MDGAQALSASAPQLRLFFREDILYISSSGKIYKLPEEDT